MVRADPACQCPVTAQGEEAAEAGAGREEQDEQEEGGIGETGRLFLRNLPYTATEDELRELFSPYGELSDVHLVLDRCGRPPLPLTTRLCNHLRAIIQFCVAIEASLRG